MILLAYGTRPEYLKIKPVISALKYLGVEYKICCVGQHTTLIEGCEYDMIVPIENDGSNRLDSIVNAVSLNSWIFNDIARVVVQGDTTTAMAVALSAFHHGIPVAHIEAGLRTEHREPHPEEANRKIISTLANLHFCPTHYDKDMIPFTEGDHAYVVGNTSIDAISHLPRHNEMRDYVVVTMHRRENLPDLTKWFATIGALAEEHSNLKFIVPLHPNPEVQKKRNILEHVDNLEIIEPVDHATMLNLIRWSTAVITDSGGIQEECNYFNRACFVCRKHTERPCATNFMCYDTDQLWEQFCKYMEDPKPFVLDCKFGDGTAGMKIAHRLYSEIKEYEAIL